MPNFHKNLTRFQTTILLILSLSLLTFMLILIYGVMTITPKPPTSTIVEQKTGKLVSSPPDFASVFAVTDRSKDTELTTQGNDLKYTDQLRTPFPADLVRNSTTNPNHRADTFDPKINADVVQSLLEVKLDLKKQSNVAATADEKKKFLEHYQGLAPHLGINVKTLIKKKSTANSSIPDLDLSELSAEITSTSNGQAETKPLKFYHLDVRANSKTKPNPSGNRSSSLTSPQFYNKDNWQTSKDIPKLEPNLKSKNEDDVINQLNNWSNVYLKQTDETFIFRFPKIIDQLGVGSSTILQGVDILYLISFQQNLELADDLKIALWHNSFQSDQVDDQTCLINFNDNYEDEMTLDVEFYLSDQNGKSCAYKIPLDSKNIKLPSGKPPVHVTDTPSGGRTIKITNTNVQTSTNVNTN